jgi:autotransporter passenger strand-loop-strand repeat protein
VRRVPQSPAPAISTFCPARWRATPTVALGGIQNDDGTVDNTILSGTQIVFAGAVASGLTIERGGYEYVLPGGTASNAVVTSGGFLNDDGAANGTTLSSGTEEIIFAGASASNTRSMLARSSSWCPAGWLPQQRSAVELWKSVAVSGAVTFATSAGGTLELDDSEHFSGMIAGFGLPDRLDLSDIPFNSGTTLNLDEAPDLMSGTLTVTNGTHSANILLLGDYVPDQFHIATDGHVGTLITDPPVDASTPMLCQSTPDALAAGGQVTAGSTGASTPTFGTRDIVTNDPSPFAEALGWLVTKPATT